VAIVGDGPAGSALAQACVGRGIDVVLLGEDRSWDNTYASFVDDLSGAETSELLGGGDIATELFISAGPSFEVWGHRRHVIDRPYGVIVNDALRSRLRAGVRHLTRTVVATEPPGSGARMVDVVGGGGVEARLVIDATGSTSGGSVAWCGGGPARRASPERQIAFGVVLPERVDDGDGPTFMDFRPVEGDPPSGIVDRAPPTFCYTVPVADGWLHEETVLATRSGVSSEFLLERLARRLRMQPGRLCQRAVRTEHVDIALGVGPPSRRVETTPFGAAAGLVHPATGFSVAASIRAAPGVAAAIASALEDAGGGFVDNEMVTAALWSRPARRTRFLHDYGLAAMVRMDAPQIRSFIDRFFELPNADWSAYLRVDADDSDVARTMWKLFGSADWRTRASLVGPLPMFLARQLRR
jgi:lycopene beta-cyclase